MTEEELNLLKEEDTIKSEVVEIEKEEEEEKEGKKKYLILLLLLLLLLIGFFTVRVGLGSDLYNTITDRVVSIFGGGRPSAPVITGGSEEWAKSRVISVEKDSKTKDKIAYYEYCIATKETTKDCEWKKTETKNVKVAKTGIYYITFRGVDTKEQKGLNSNTEVAYIDNNNPTISNIEVTKITTNSVDIEVKANDKHSGIKTYEYSLDNKEYALGKNKYTFKELKKNTKYTLYIKVTDKVGNITILSIDVKTNDEETCTLNCDTDDDGKCDLNCDTDGDNKCDLNCDTDGDNKCDLNCDTDNDGDCDLNCDEDGDGKCDSKCEIPHDKPNVDIDDDNKDDDNKDDDNKDDDNKDDDNKDDDNKDDDNKDDDNKDDDNKDDDNKDDDNKDDDNKDDDDKDDDTVDEEEKVEIPEIHLNDVPVEFIYGDKYQLPTYVSFGKDTGTYECIVEGKEYKDTSTLPMGEHLIVCTATSSKNIKTMVEKTVNVIVGKGEEEVWNGWIRLNLYYPDNSTNWEWRLGKEGEVRTGYDNTDWQAYTGPILVKLDDVDDIYIRYDINGETVIVAPSGKAAVSIEPDSYSIKKDSKTKVTIYYDALATKKEYRIDNGEWQEYKEPFEVGPNTIIDARVNKEEKVYDSEGTYLYTDKTSNNDQVFISEIVEKTEDGGSGEVSGTTPGGVSFVTTVTSGGDTVTTITGDYTPETYLKGPEISSTPSSSLTESVKVRIRPQEVADKIYVSVGYGKYEEYTEEFEVTQNTMIKAYYIRYKDGKTSDVSYYHVQNIKEPNLPYVKISASPSDYLSKVQDEVKVTITGSDYEKLEYSFDGIIYKEYTEALTIKESATVYAKGTNSNGVKVEKLSITTKTPPVIPEELSIHIELDPDKERVEGLTNEIKVEITYDEKATEKYYKLGYYGTWKEYTEPFIVKSNTTIYSYCVSEDGRGNAQKSVDYLTTGISDPEIKANPKTSSPQVKIEIVYDEKAEITRYQIGNGAMLEYNGPFYVYENTTIRAYNKNSLGYEATSEYIVSNIVSSPKYTYLDMGSYYIIKLNYPEASTDDEQEYKWKESGKWKKYDKNGILLVKPEYKDEIITSDGIKVTDKDGKEVVFTDHYYLLDVPMAELMENLFMRWDTGKIAAPKIYVSPKTEPTREVEVNISYPSGVMQKLYKVVTPDGKDTGWLVNNGTFTVTNNNAVVYAKGVSINKTDSEVASVKITNIDDEAPVIKYVADLTNPKQKVTVQVTVEDNMLIDKIKWSEGELSKEYFETSGNSIVNNGTFTVTKTGKYTIYAVDSLGNATVEVIEVTNIDKNAPKIAIDVLTKEYGTTAKVSIDYGDSSIKEYSLGNNTTYKTYTDVIEILANDLLNLVNPDGTLTIYARGTDEAGNITEVSEIIYVLDLDAPKAPIIHAASGYPTLTEYGVKYTDKSYIVYDNRNDILNYYSIDNGTTWKIYEGPFEISSGTILAKSVKKVSGLTIQSSKKVDMPTDALLTTAFDNDTATGISSNKTKKIYYLNIDESVYGNRFYYIYTANGGGSSGQSTVTVEMLDNANVVLQSFVNTTTISMQKQQILVPDNTYRIKFTIAYGSGWGSTSDSTVYEVGINKDPIINNIKYYPIITETGIENGYNEVTIKYYQNSIQRLYRINSGEWKEYKDKKIRLELNDKIETKGIDKNGNETNIISYTAILPTDGLLVSAYDKNNSTGISSNKSSNSYYINVDESVYGNRFYYIYTANGGGSSGQSTVKIEMLDSDNVSLFSFVNTEVISNQTKTIVIPKNTTKIKFTIAYGSGWGSTSNSTLYEIGINMTPIINVTKKYPTLTENGIKAGYNEVTIDYYQTSVQKLYRINSGEWKEYSNEKIRLELNDKIDTKGIDKAGNETAVTSYTAILPTDGLLASAYDKNNSTGIASENTTKTYYLNLSPNMYNKKLYYLYTANGGGSSGQSTVKIELYDSDNVLLTSFVNNGTVKNATQSISIPINSYKVKFTIAFGSGWGSKSNSTLYEVWGDMTSTTSEENLAISKTASPKISINTTALSDEKTISIEYPEGYTNEYSLDLGNTWLPYEGSITVNKSSVILARTIDGDEIISSSSFTITSIASSETNEEEISISLDELPDRILVGSDYKLPTSVTGKEYTCTTNNEEVDNTKDLIVGNYDIICTVKSSSGAEKTISKQIEVYKEETDEIEGEENE